MSRATIVRLDAAFTALDSAAMRACYAKGATFEGWTPLLRNKVRAQAAANLRRFLAKG